MCTEKYRADSRAREVKVLEVRRAPPSWAPRWLTRELVEGNQPRKSEITLSPVTPRVYWVTPAPNRVVGSHISVELDPPPPPEAVLSGV